MGTQASITTAEPNPGPAYDSTPRIRTGEITAIRVWTLGDSYNGEGPAYLHSVYMRNRWEPGEIVRAEAVTPYWGEGVHAFKTLDRALREYQGMADMVVGEVALWGEVIEFEHGWKGEYAKITKLSFCRGMLFRRYRLWKLRRMYGV